MTTRRTFLKTGAAVGGALIAGLTPGLARAADALAARAAGQPRRKLSILVLGGTGFIGPHQVRYAVSRGHTVTTFTRGRREADLPKEVEHLQGDRNGQLDALKGRKWDAVIDNSATNPDWVRQSAQLLKDSAGQYMFVSTTGVFLPYLTPNIDESVQPRLEDPPGTQGAPTYGVQKAQAEREAQAAFGDRATIVRPHFIVGPGDTSDRFPYWPVRLARGGEVLVPGRRTDPVQLIDVRDLTEWMVRLLEDRKTGVYNVAGPRETLTMARFVEEVGKGVKSTAQLTWVDDYDFLTEHRIGGAVPWIRLTGPNLYMTSIKFDRALATGLTFRPLAQTAADTLAWWQTVPAERREKPRFWITPEREQEVLAAWKARKG